MYLILYSLKKVDKNIQKQNKIVINNSDSPLLLIPIIENIFPSMGKSLTSFFSAIIDINGIMAAIEKDSKIPFTINKKIKKNNCFFLFLLKKKYNL